MKNILVTGGAGFIGSNFLNLFVPMHPELNFINLDKLTYASNLLNIEAIKDKIDYTFIQADIADSDALDRVFNKYIPDTIVHFAAVSHVDRSILGPREFINTNIIGTFNLLEMCRKHWTNFDHKLFLHVSTDEVYGSLGEEGFFTEKTAYDPSSPYSASKASSDHLVKAYYRTYDLPVKITNCSNNYGPYQFPEKLIPFMIINALERKPLPIYGDGSNVRDWLYVDDHNLALWSVMEKGRLGDTYNIGGNNEQKNIDLVNKICEILAGEMDEDVARYKELITFIKDRPGHDHRYALDASKITRELGWKPQETLFSGLHKTIKWYLDNQEWLEQVKTGDYRSWLEQHYNKR